MSLFQIKSIGPASASFDATTIIITDSAAATASGQRVVAEDEFGNEQYYFISGGRVWYVGCPDVLPDNNIQGFQIELNRPFWADIVLEAADLFEA